MNVPQILAELRAEKDRMEEAILSLENLIAATGVKRRGRPPAWLTAKKGAPATATKKRRGRPPKQAS